MGKLFRRGKIWWYQYQGKRVSTRCTDKKAAELVARRIEREAADPFHDPENQAATFEECMNTFLQLQPSKGRAAGTIKGNRQHAGHLMRLMGPGRDVNGITAQVVDGYVAKRLDEGAAKSTVHKELSTLRGCLKTAARHGRFRRSLEQVMPELERDYVPRTTWLNLEQIDRLLEQLQPHRAQHVAFMVATATRFEESMAAQLEDIEPKTIRIRGTKTALSAQRIPRLKVFGKLLDFAMPGMPFAPWGNVRRDMAAACRRAGLPTITPNDLRRSAASILLSLGVDVRTIAAFLRHVDSRMVERVYGRMKVEDLGALIDRLTGTQDAQSSSE